MNNSFDTLFNNEKIVCLKYEGISLPLIPTHLSYLITWLDFVPNYNDTDIKYITPIGTPVSVIPKYSDIISINFNERDCIGLTGHQLALINLLYKLYLEH